MSDKVQGKQADKNLDTSQQDRIPLQELISLLYIHTHRLFIYLFIHLYNLYEMNLHVNL